MEIKENILDGSRRIRLGWLVVCTLCTFSFIMSCGSRNAREEATTEENLDSVIIELKRLPDTCYASAKTLSWDVTVHDTSTVGTLQYLYDPYEDTTWNVLTFRGGQRRDMPKAGQLDTIPSMLQIVWQFETEYDRDSTQFGTWGGGSGWTGQPLYVDWGEREGYPSKQEILVGSLCGRVYRLDFQTGEPSRDEIFIGNVLKGTLSLDPDLNGLLYVGHGVVKRQPFGASIIDLKKNEIIQEYGRDNKAYRGWGACDGSAIVAGGFLFRAAENGVIYKYSRTPEGLVLHTSARYRDARKRAPGMEASIAIFRNYGYVSDNNGNIICLNLDNLSPVWTYDNHDDSDATPVLEIVDDVPYVYSGTEVDKQDASGVSYLVKLNGLTGEKIWEYRHPCGKYTKMEGGMYTTPLLGHGDCEGMLFTNFETHHPALAGDFVALDRRTGEVLYTLPFTRYAWSSPLPFYNKEGHLYIVQPDCKGTLFLLEGKTGRVIHSLQVGLNFESSAAIVGDCLVVGSRGHHIFKVKVQ